ncbi:hypothetical protein, partial [Bacillus cereus]|uniref:hypothetical protein n=1 Tax=Bacillus cereus TaxID=1396 RepID=UPI002852634A
GVRNDCTRKCNGLSSVKWQKTFISLRNPGGYIRHALSYKKRTLRISERTLFMHVCAYRQAAVCFVLFIVPCMVTKKILESGKML